MARKLRIEYPGAVYHVTARGNDRQRIFQTDADRGHLLEFLAEGQERYEVRLFAYVLMQTHYHLVVQTEHPNLHSLMHYLNTAYTVWSNKRNGRSGHLFEGPYKAIVMQEDGYLGTSSRSCWGRSGSWPKKSWGRVSGAENCRSNCCSMRSRRRWG